jgi:hypothetical protein
MAKFSEGFVRNLVEKLNNVAIPKTIRKEGELEAIIYKTVRNYTKKALGVGDAKIDDIVFTHGVNWKKSKKDQNVIVYGCENTSDIFIKERRLDTIYIELKFSKRRGNKEASALPGDLQRAIGQSIIASLVHRYVICLIVCETKIRKRKGKDYSNELQEKLRRDHRIELIVRSMS